MKDEVETAVERLLVALGLEIALDPHMRDTPRRVAAMYRELLTQPEFEFTVFPNEEKLDQLILANRIPFHSLCAHHLAIFTGWASVAYIPLHTIAGLSKLARTVDYFAHRPQTQEHLTHQVGEFLMDKLSPLGVGVILEAEHHCMAVRGIKKDGIVTKTSYMRGVFMSSAPAREEMLRLVYGN
jgi:GTP cyclohydrolase I